MSLRDTINGTTPGDKILFMLLLIVSLLGIVFIKDVLPHAGDVTIEVEGKTTHRYPLNADRSIKIEGPHGRLTVEIKDKRARVLEASCPNKLCERQGWIERGAIICLPGRISVIVGKPDELKPGKIDAITG